MGITKVLAGLAWRQRFTTQMGCLKGCLDFLNIQVTYPWLYGATGQAFVLNIERSLAISGLTHWDTRMVSNLAPNLGFRIQPVVVGEGEAAWAGVRDCLDRGLPCYGLEETEFSADYFIITGYSQRGYTYSSWEDGGPIPWQPRYQDQVNRQQVFCVSPCSPSTQEKTLRDVLISIMAYTYTPRAWAVHSDYVSGPSAYEAWAVALDTGEGLCDGHLNNLVAWYECRQMAVDFLCAVRECLPGRFGASLYCAAQQYALVCGYLKKSLDLVPDRWNPFDHQARWQSHESADILRKAGTTEQLALAALGGMLDDLDRSTFRISCGGQLGSDCPPRLTPLN